MRSAIASSRMKGTMPRKRKAQLGRTRLIALIDENTTAGRLRERIHANGRISKSSNSHTLGEWKIMRSPPQAVVQLLPIAFGERSA
jgi:hypothetical protein